MSSIRDYYYIPRLSVSLLKATANPRLFWLKKNRPELFERDSTKALRIGSAVDCLLTCPEEWEAAFMILDYQKPYGLMGKFVDALPKGITKDSPIESYLGAYVASGYKMSIDWVVFKFWDSIDATSYYAGIHADFGEKTPIYKDEIDTVYKAVDSIKANEFTLKFFLNEEEEIELIHQIQIIFEYKGYDCKCMLDGVRIDHKSKTITPFDLKTSSVSVYDFPSRYLTFGYYLQAAFYEAALYSEASPFKQLLEDGYKIQDFLFIVTHTGKYAYDPAVIYVTSREERSYGITGGVINGKKYKGIDTLLAEYDFYLREDRWDLPLDLIESQGEIPLRAFTYAGELANSSMEALDV